MCLAGWTVSRWGWSLQWDWLQAHSTKVCLEHSKHTGPSTQVSQWGFTTGQCTVPYNHPSNKNEEFKKHRLLFCIKTEISNNFVLFLHDGIASFTESDNRSIMQIHMLTKSTIYQHILQEWLRNACNWMDWGGWLSLPIWKAKKAES